MASAAIAAATKINPWIMAASIFGNAFGGGISAFQNSRNAQQQALANEPQKAMLLDQYSQLAGAPDLSRLIEGQSRSLTQALAGSRADSFNRGTSAVNSAGVSSGGLASAQGNSIAAQAAAQLAQVRLDEDFRRRGLQAEIASSPVLGMPNADQFNPLADGFLGALTGGIGGGLSNLADQRQAGVLDSQTAQLLALLQGSGGNNIASPPTAAPAISVVPNAGVSYNPPVLGNRESSVTPDYVNYLTRSNLSPSFTY